MASIYADEHRALQEEFGTTKLAAMLDENWLHDQITDVEKAFIEGRDMFFLSTVDPEGNPTVSYKGGPTGFVKVLDDRTLVFPGYDGNGMFYSMGNIVGQGKVGMLFIDFETPHRVRVQGTAEFLRDHPLLADYTEAKYLVRVTVGKIWVNCPRYIHRYKKLDQSRYVPKAACETPLALWKRLDMVQDVLPEHEKPRVEKEGLISLEEYEAKVARGDS
ncbi:MAG: pyridoxamine 5'-phosphate oxidase family protein [Methyloversatilis sp.]|jgi:predicted pyridoxine 5'-phosphate oxidase superfamily flavin-nucleotide-binding protein|nr:pyridoxamine 5'-phosphate oxidase family protein [Methyloversatilis sp.]MBP6193056.1 pyridoxamine 5'-phosphate oxidase family protein [Methyloversatilis sp.]MBP9116561.1 pyridoxamine 5'-phosphate oxidase family protein [Methyloversatilis sp.]